MFRTVYLAAAAFTTAPGPDGECAKSKTFPVRRGVIQGDITSPLFFILALQLILLRHDKRNDKGVPFGDTFVHTLAYVNDAALAEFGDDEGVTKLTERLSAIVKGSRDDADMEVKISKTKGIHVRPQAPISQTTAESPQFVNLNALT